MKKEIIGLFCGLLLLASCNSDTKQIQQSAQGYLEALGNYRPADARPYATEQTCNITLNFFEKLVAHTDTAVYANNMPATITLGNITMDDTSAQVAYHKSTPSTQQDGTVNLVKRDGKWLVDQVIQVPGLMQAIMDTAAAAPAFDQETIEEMRRNGPHKASEMTMQPKVTN